MGMRDRNCITHEERKKYVAKNTVRESKEWFRLKDAKKMVLMGIKKIFWKCGKTAKCQAFLS